MIVCYGPKEKDMINDCRGTVSSEPPLMLAVAGGHVDAVHWLLKRGANVHLADRFGKSALEMVRKKAKLPYDYNNFKIILHLLEEANDFSGDVALAEALRQEGNQLFLEKQFKRAIVKVK